MNKEMGFQLFEIISETIFLHLTEILSIEGQSVSLLSVLWNYNTLMVKLTYSLF